MFAILSWLQESISQINFLLDGPKKGVWVFFLGLFLYKYLAKKHNFIFMQQRDEIDGRTSL